MNKSALVSSFLTPAETLISAQAARLQRIAELDREIASLEALLEPGALYDIPTVLYHEPHEIPGFEEALQRHLLWAPRLKDYLQRRIATRYSQEQERKTLFIRQYHSWQRRLRPLEANDPPLPPAPVARQPEAVSIGNAAARASRRATASDAVRSEEELNRVLLSLLEQERDNPATRWMGTLAVTPAMVAATPKHIFGDVNVFIDRNGLCPQHEAISMDGAPIPRGPSFNGLIPSAPGVVCSIADVVWTEAEQRIFVDKFLAYPKNFRKIASFLPYKCTANCVAFYYRQKKKLKLKQLRRLAASEANAGKAKPPPKKSLHSGTSSFGGGSHFPPVGPSRHQKSTSTGGSSRKPGRPPKKKSTSSSTATREEIASFSSMEEGTTSAGGGLAIDGAGSDLSSTAASLLSLAAVMAPNSPLTDGSRSSRRKATGREGGEGEEYSSLIDPEPGKGQDYQASHM